MTVLLGAAMIPCALIDSADGRAETYVFEVSAFGSILIGSCMWVLSRGDIERTGQREGFLLTVLVWVFLPMIASIPFLASGMTVTDSLFETVSGLTTTGATVLTGLDSMPRGLLLWRAILQWIGGIGIIVTAIAILPQQIPAAHHRHRGVSGFHLPADLNALCLALLSHWYGLV